MPSQQRLTSITAGSLVPNDSRHVPKSTFPRKARSPAEIPAVKDSRDTMRYLILPSSLGAVLVARSVATGGLSAVLLDDDRAVLVAELRRRFSDMRVEAGDGDSALRALATEVVALVESPADPDCAVDAPLDARGTAFQQLVWNTLRGIPAGTTVTYAELARRVGRPNAVRAVASACAANPLAIVVPCHRVVRSDGGLSGYRWGVERKRALLAREAALGGDASGGHPDATTSSDTRTNRPEATAVSPRDAA